VNRRREQEADANFLDGFRYALRGKVDAHAEVFQHVRGAAARADRAVAVLGDVDARARYDKSCGRGHVESAGGVAAGTARIDERFDRERRIAGENRRGVAAHGCSESDQLVDRLALHAQTGEQRGDLCVVSAAGENFFHRGFGFDA